MEGTVVTVNKIGDTTESSEIVFQGTSDSNATVEFKPEISDDQLAADVTDVVYEVFFVSPKGEIERKFFSVTFVKNGQKVLLSDKEVIEKDQNVTVESNFTGKEPVEENGNRNTPTATASYISCKPIGLGADLCISDEKYYTQPKQRLEKFMLEMENQQK